MTNKRYFILILLILVAFTGQAHKKASWNIIVDTDGAADDFRMLQIVLASPDFNLNAVCTSDGVLAPEQSAAKIKGMLNYYLHEGIPVAAGKSLRKEFTHRDFVNSIKWPGEASIEFSQNTIALFVESLNMHARKNVILVSGPLTNIAELFKTHPESISKIEHILWYHNPENPGMNYLRDTESANVVMKSFPEITFIHAGNSQISLNKEFLSFLKSLNNIYVNSLSEFLYQDRLANHNYLGNYPVWDECLPMFLLFPDMFKENNNAFTPNPADLLMNILAVLHVNRSIEGVVWQKNSTEKTYLREDVYTITDSLIQKFGYNEFQVLAMTSEFHGHLGLYSIMGAKMGLRAMQYFSVGLDELEVWSYAGKKPPLSCMHDGLQFSTGASLGLGTIHVVEDLAFSPKAKFVYGNRKIMIELKPAMQAEFKQDIKTSIEKYGLLTDAYWDEIRRIGLDYWLSLDKNEIFTIRVIE
ncbi:MAG: nucleoside hydrolase [Bacteroidota bacterium]|nr:nucleoside hydrolase [Bacteroidota bacterium]